MDGKIKVSVVIPSYNYAKYLDQAIESVFSQTYKNWELVIIDDGSSDNSVEIIKSWVKKYPDKIKFLTHPGGENKGIVATYKLALENCGGEYVAFLEADDYWFENNLAEKVKILEQNKDVILVYSQVLLCGEKIQHMEKYIEENRIKMDEPFYAFNVPFYQTVYTFSCAVIRKEFVKDSDFDGIPKKYDSFFDRWFWSHMCMRGKFFCIAKKLVAWRIHKNSYAQKNRLPESDIEKEFNRVLRKKLAVEAIISKNSLSDRFLEFLMFDNERVLKIGETKIKENQLNILKLASFLSPYFIIKFLMKK